MHGVQFNALLRTFQESTIILGDDSFGGTMDAICKRAITGAVSRDKDGHWRRTHGGFNMKIALDCGEGEYV